MEYYLDIKIVPDAEVPTYFIRNKVYSKLHKALSTLDLTDIGVSFPNYKIKLGNTIRIHSSENSLSKLQSMNWLGGLSGYCEITEIQAIPSGVKYRTVSRKQSNMTEAKLDRRVAYQKAKEEIKTEQEEEAYKKQYKVKMFESSLDNPYLELHSSSNNNNYRIFIEFGELKDNPVTGKFNQFGLSKTATVPWF